MKILPRKKKEESKTTLGELVRGETFKFRHQKEPIFMVVQMPRCDISDPVRGYVELSTGDVYSMEGTNETSWVDRVPGGFLEEDE